MTNALIGPIIYKADIGGELGGVLLVGLFIAIFAFLNAMGLIFIEGYSNRVDSLNGKIPNLDNEKFRFSDLKTFNLSFWFIVGNVVFTYCAIFPPF